MFWGAGCGRPMNGLQCCAQGSRMDKPRRGSGKGASRLEPVMSTVLQYRKTMMDLQEELLRQSLSRTRSGISRVRSGLAASMSGTGFVLGSLGAPGALEQEGDAAFYRPLLGLNKSMARTTPAKEVNALGAPGERVNEICQGEEGCMASHLVVANKAEGSLELQGMECTPSLNHQPPVSTFGSNESKPDSYRISAFAPSVSNFEDASDKREHEEDCGETDGSNQSERGSLGALYQKHGNEDAEVCPFCGQVLPAQHQDGIKGLVEDNGKHPAVDQPGTEPSTCDSEGNARSLDCTIPESTESTPPDNWVLASKWTAGSVPALQTLCSHQQTRFHDKEKKMESTCELLCALRDRLQNMQDVLTTFVSKPE